MVVRCVEDPSAFLDAALPLLGEDEARHNLILGVAASARDDLTLYREKRFWIVEDGREVAGAAMRTPPHNLILARPRTDAALHALAGAIDEELPGVVGARPEVQAFAGAWGARTGVEARVRSEQGLYALERVRPVAAAPGRFREATPDERDLLVDWWREFALEVFGEGLEADAAERNVDHRLASPAAGIRVWEDEGPVSLAAFGGPTPNGIRIGPVYTPPHLRGRGYASALVAHLSAALLADGRRFCFLYTDLANPTSNRIYERIGYERIGESAEIVFEPAA